MSQPYWPVVQAMVSTADITSKVQSSTQGRALYWRVADWSALSSLLFALLEQMRVRGPENKQQQQQKLED